MPSIFKHLDVLEQAGLAKRGKEARWRPRSQDATLLKEAADQVEYYPSFWEQSRNRLDNYLCEVSQEESLHGKRKT